MSLKRLLHVLGLGDRTSEEHLRAIAKRRFALDSLTDEQLRESARSLPAVAGIVETFALTAAIAKRSLGLDMFEVQIAGALAMRRGDVAEMQTGEGKTLAAVPAVAWFALHRRGVHVLTANDYLARRDAGWMKPIYDWFGLSVGHISQGMTIEERRAGYLCDITYATANEVGFDYLRDGMARDLEELVQRGFAFAVIDEADSILIDEARIPLIIAGEAAGNSDFAERANLVARGMQAGVHFTTGQFSRIVQLTDAGIAQAERAFRCGNLFDEQNLTIHTAVQDALHAHVLLNRDVDYVVKGNAVEMVDAFKGRIAQNRRWPAGLQTAVEAKEGVRPKQQGRILGSITVQALCGFYDSICGMTGTAATQAEEFWRIYKLPASVIRPNRASIRKDLPDVVFRLGDDRDRAVVQEICEAHAAGRPVLVGTASVGQSEHFSALLRAAGIRHSVLNARNDEAEAAIVAQAGGLGAVTVSTNMAGRGTDILLGGNPARHRDHVIELGGLYVIGTTKHEARRIDLQLRGRAGRQGDPGTTRFFIALDDLLLLKFGIGNGDDVDHVQRTAESQNLEIRELLWKYEGALEGQRSAAAGMRRGILDDPDREVRHVKLAIFDDLWADYLANIAELRNGIHWVSWTGRDPLHSFLKSVEAIYADFQITLREEVAAALLAKNFDGQTYGRGATWTYLSTDQPFGSLSERIISGMVKKGRQLRRKTAG